MALAPGFEQQPDSALKGESDLTGSFPRTPSCASTASCQLSLTLRVSMVHSQEEINTRRGQEVVYNHWGQGR